MTFHAVLEGLWPADLAATLGVQAGQVYFGERPQQVTRTDKEVLVKRLPPREIGKTGFETDTDLEYEVTVRVTGPSDANASWKLQQDSVEADLRALVKKYHGRPLAAGIAAALGANGTYVGAVASEIRAGLIDDENVYEGVARVAWEVLNTT